ncbi:MAG TPA: hypothetical protein VMY59_04415 [Candidatus Thermoplasmatota archaeon]|nr:hypothetical protein [Candidatus Thermoplasmatota archaeon]
MTIAEKIIALSQKKKLHFALLDPDKQPPQVAVGTLHRQLLTQEAAQSWLEDLPCCPKNR